MAAGSKSAPERAKAAASKEERARDGKLAVREYQLSQSAVLTNMERLRALRLSQQSQPPPVIEPKRADSKKRSDGKKSRAKKND